MIKEINECVGCDIPCIDCGRKHVERLFCDFCDLQITAGYRFEGEDYCADCLTSLLKKRFFDTKETIEKFFDFVYRNSPWVLEEIENDSYQSLLGELDSEYLDDMISYLGIAAKRIWE